MKPIAAIGCSRAGRSTLARELGAVTGIEVIHLDGLFSKPGWVETPKDEWRRINEEIVKGDSLIIDGNYGGTTDIRVAAADTVIFMDFPRRICILRVFRRRFAGPRSDLDPGCPERFYIESFRWVWAFRSGSRLKILASLEPFRDDNQVITLRIPREARRFLDRLSREHQQ